MPSIEAKYFLKLPHFQVPREIDLQDNFKAIERWANTLTLPDPEVSVPGVGSGLSQVPGVPPTLFVNVDGSSLVIVGNALRVNTNGITLAHMASGSVGSDEIINGSVGSSELAVGAVDTANIQADAVTAIELADNAVGSAAIAANAVGSSEILDASITSSDIGLNQITSGLIANNAITFSKMGTDFPRFFVSKGAGQGLGAGATAITFTGETYDVGNWHSSGSSSFFIPDAGLCIFAGFVEFSPSLDDNIYAGAEIVVNGVRIALDGDNTEWSERPAHSVCVAFHATAGTQVQLRAFSELPQTLSSAAFSGCTVAN